MRRGLRLTWSCDMRVRLRWGQREMIPGSELGLEVTEKGRQTSSFLTYGGVPFLSRWKTQSGLPGLSQKVPALNHLSQPLPPTFPPSPSSPVLAQVRLLPGHSTCDGGLCPACFQAAVYGRVLQAFQAGLSQLRPHPRGEAGHGAPSPTPPGPCQGPDLSPPFCRGPGPCTPHLASQGDNLTSSDTQRWGQAFKAVTGETVGPRSLAPLPQRPFVQKHASGHETEDNCGTAMPLNAGN